MSSEEVLVGVDPHKGHNALVVLDALKPSSGRRG